MAEAGGARLTEQFQHVLWVVTGINHVRKARAVADALRRLPGMMEAEAAVGLVRVEIDRRQLDDRRLRAVLDQHGVGVRPDEGHEGHDHGDGEHSHGAPFGERSELIFAVTSALLWATGFALEVLSEVGDGGPHRAVHRRRRVRRLLHPAGSYRERPQPPFRDRLPAPVAPG